jgi:hypothetical protein
MNELVTISPALLSFLAHFGERVAEFQEELVEDLRPTVMDRYRQSIARRWYDTGATHNTLLEKRERQAPRSMFRVEATTPYAKFGEWGTGQRGQATGQPAPSGYKYGSKRGIAARRYTRLAVAEMTPELRAQARARVAAFARNVAVN